MTLDAKRIKRVMIFGVPGAGKSTFAEKLSTATGVPVLHLDTIYFDADWAKRNTEDFLKDQRDWIEKETWIIEGNSIKTLSLRYQQADLCLYFKVNRWLCLWRVFKRLVLRRKTDCLPNGCIDRPSWRLLSYLWTFEKRVSPILEKLKEDHPQTLIQTLETDQAANKAYDFLRVAITTGHRVVTDS